MRPHFSTVAYVTLLAFLVPLSPAQQDAQDHTPISDRVDALLSAFHRHGMFEGAVLLAMHGKIIYKNGFGLANRDWDSRIGPDTKFSIASLGKAITAHLALNLVDDDLLELNEPIERWLPHIDGHIGRAVTLHDLLTHSSGLGWWADGEPNYYQKTYSLDDLVERAEKLELEFEPGTRTLYSNSGYNIVAAVIEAATGKPFEKVMQERIFDPAGMSDSGFVWVHDVVSRRATGYDRLPTGEYVPAPHNPQSYAIGAGGLYSTVEDMFRWKQFLDRDLSTESLQAMFAQHFVRTGYGLDIARYTKKQGGGGKYAVGLGGTFGFASVLGLCLDDDHFMVVLSNVRQLDQGRIANALINTILGYDVPPPFGPVPTERFFRGLLERGPEATLAGAGVVPDEATINRAGYAFLGHRRLDEAIALFKFNVGAHPTSWNAFDSLSEAYEVAGLRDLAIETAENSLELNPNNEASSARLRRLRR